MRMTPERVQQLVLKWASDRNIIFGSNSSKQCEKLGEELVELAFAIGAKDTEKIADSIGDMLVVLTIISEQESTDIFSCYEGAYHEIKDRKGMMIGGKFVKEAS